MGIGLGSVPSQLAFLKRQKLLVATWLQLFVLLVIMMGKWLLLRKLSSVDHVSEGADLGSHILRSVAENVPEDILRCVSEPVFSRHEPDILVHSLLFFLFQMFD